MNSLLIILIIVLLFYICQCAKEQFDNSLYLGYGGEPQFRDMTEDYGVIQDGLKTGSWRNCRREKSFRWCFNNWTGSG